MRASHFLAGLAVLCLCLHVEAQRRVDTTYASRINAVFASLEKQRIPYGILKDYGLAFTSLDNFNGITSLSDSNLITPGVFRSIYSSIGASRIHSSATGIVNPDTLDNSWQAYRDTSRITLAGLFFNYSKFKPNAANNTVTVSSGKLYDKYVNGSWQNPYDPDQAFAVSPSINYFAGKAFDVFLPADLWLTNAGGSIVSLTVNLNDGLGFRAIQPGASVPVSYVDTGTKEWIFKLTLSNSLVLHSHSMVRVIDELGDANARFGNRNFEQIDMEASEAYLGQKARGMITISYANADLGLRRPLIVVEGFDPGYYLVPENKIGVSTFRGFLRHVADKFSNLKTILLDLPQYDIIYLDFHNGTDYIQRNALLLEQVIRWVNANKEPLSGATYAPNVVWGQSMGGLVARWALKDMEDKGEKHAVRLYISHDAPHQGANVPQGFQHLARHLRQLYLQTGTTAGVIELWQFLQSDVSPFLALSIANSPAARQMLINYVNDNNQVDNSMHNAWQSALMQKGYPQGDGVTPFRKIAVSNGSECGTTQPFGPGHNLLTYVGKGNTSFWGDLIAMAGGPIGAFLINQPALFLSVLPGQNSWSIDLFINARANGIVSRVYKGKVTYQKDILWLIPVSVTITDLSVNAGYSDITLDEFPGGAYVLPVNLGSASYQSWFAAYNVYATNEPAFDFVPVASALDIGGGAVTLSRGNYLASYVGATPPGAPLGSPFQNFITAYQGNSQNEQHIAINQRNANWIAAELNALPTSADCSIYCTYTSISGSPLVCQSQVYTVPAISGVAYSWALSDYANASGVTNGNQYTVTRQNGGNGAVNVVVTLSGAECGSVTKILPIYVGAPQPISGIVTTNQLFKCRVLRYKWEVTGAEGATNFQWVYQNITQNTFPTVFQNGPSRLANGNWNEESNCDQTLVTINATNGCSTVPQTYWFNSDECPPYYPPDCYYGRSLELMPNPVVSITRISLVDDPQAPAASEPKKIKKLRIVDNLGNLRRQLNGNDAASMSIDLSGLPAGAYTVIVWDGKAWIGKQALKQ